MGRWFDSILDHLIRDQSGESRLKRTVFEIVMAVIIVIIVMIFD